MTNTCKNHESCVENALKAAETVCRQKGLRFTKLRRLVLETMWQSHSPTKAYDILDKLKLEHASAKPATVYRALDFLLESGLIHKLSSRNAYIGCSHPLKHGECYFLICKQCGEVKECCDASLTRVIDGVSHKNKFQSSHTTLEIEGMCRRCSGVRGE